MTWDELDRELQDLAQSAETAKADMSIVHYHFDVDDEFWTAEQRDTALSNLEDARSALQGPKSPADILAAISELESEIQRRPLVST